MTAFRRIRVTEPFLPQAAQAFSLTHSRCQTCPGFIVELCEAQSRKLSEPGRIEFTNTREALLPNRYNRVHV
jgi:hypothetical protein